MYIYALCVHLSLHKCYVYVHTSCIVNFMDYLSFLATFCVLYQFFNCAFISMHPVFVFALVTLFLMRSLC